MKRKQAQESLFDAGVLTAGATTGQPVAPAVSARVSAGDSHDRAAKMESPTRALALVEAAVESGPTDPRQDEDWAIHAPHPLTAVRPLGSQRTMTCLHCAEEVIVVEPQGPLINPETFVCGECLVPVSTGGA